MFTKILLLGLLFSPGLLPAQAADSATPPRPERHVHLSPTEVQIFQLTHTGPVYPADARAAHIGGNVVMDAIISPEGKVIDLKVVSGAEPLRQAAINCARQWTYRPYLQDGEPIFIDTTLTVSFLMLH